MRLSHLRCSNPPDNVRSSRMLASRWSSLISYSHHTASGPFCFWCVSTSWLDFMGGFPPSSMTLFSLLGNSQSGLLNHTALVSFRKAYFNCGELFFPVERSPVDLPRWPQLHWAQSSPVKDPGDRILPCLPDAYVNSKWQAPIKVSNTKPEHVCL